ncbi:MAG: metallophosphoesterase family protein [Saprospiraceae bacterium]|nr:metallophosphoesterase family protein [Saprospiraceae bacterium]
MTIGVLSDTHGFLDHRVFSHFEKCDEIWHAGDIGSLQVLDALQNFKPTRAVFGNIDGRDIRSRIPEFSYFMADGMKVFMTHIAGKFGTYNADVRAKIHEHQPHVLVCGHSHILKIAYDHSNHLLYLNPGAAGKQGFHKVQTLVRLRIVQASIQGAEVIELSN